MSTLGAYLKELREKKALSLKDVYAATGVSDSKLSKIENGKNKEPSPFDLKKLAGFYCVDIISLYMIAGYLDKSSIADFARFFKGVDLLNEEEKHLIQHLIDLLIKRHN